MNVNRDFIVADSGARESFGTGMVRDIRAGKGRFDLITPIPLRRLAKVYESGALKYEARNWEKGSPLSRFLDSAKRHINDYEMICLYQREGVPLERLPADVNPNEDHLAQAAWNLFSIMHHQDLRPEFDDLSVKKLVAAVAGIALTAVPAKPVKRAAPKRKAA